MFHELVFDASYLTQTLLFPFVSNREDIITPALEGLVTNLGGVIDDASSAFEQVQGNDIYQAAIGAVPGVGTSPLLMAFFCRSI